MQSRWQKQSEIESSEEKTQYPISAWSGIGLFSIFEIGTLLKIISPKQPTEP